MKRPKHAGGHKSINNLGAFAHPPKASDRTTRVGPLPNQVGKASPMMGAKVAVPPGNVSKPRMKKTKMKASH